MIAEPIRRADPTQRQRDALASRRTQIETLLGMAESLSPGDRALIRSMYDRGMSAAELARAAGVGAQGIRRRIRRLMDRMADPMFRYVLHSKQHWPRARMRVAEMIFLQGAGQRETAAALSMSLHNVRQHAAAVQAMYEQTRLLLEHGV